MSNSNARLAFSVHNAVFIEALREFLGLSVLDNPLVCGCLRGREWEAVNPHNDDFIVEHWQKTKASPARGV